MADDTDTSVISGSPVCGAKLYLILPGEDEPSVFEECDKTPAHQSYHGTMSGYNWHTYDPRAEAAVREQAAQDIEATDTPPRWWDWGDDHPCFGTGLELAAYIVRGGR